MSMRKSALAVLLVLAMAGTEAQVVKYKVAGKTESIEAAEFDFVYKKNNMQTEVPMPRDDYKRLFAIYKLKVEEARQMGLDTLRSYKEECEGYYNDLAEPYLTDTTAVAALQQLCFERAKSEIDASHILINVKPTASPADTLEAYNKLNEIREQILKGADFAQMAAMHSDCPSGKQSGGRLGFFGPLSMVKEFEDAAYNAATGEVTPVFRTQFGFHIVKVNSRRPFEGERLTAHIMQMVSQTASAEERAAARAKSDSIWEALNAGADFAQMAAAHSQDFQSARMGGQLPWISRNQIVAQYADAAFALKNAGDYTATVESPFGFHIIKLIDVHSEMPRQKVDAMVGQMLRQTRDIAMRSLELYGVAKRSEAKYPLTVNEEAWRTVEGIVLGSEPDSVKSAKCKAFTTPLFTIAGKPYTAADVDLPKNWFINQMPVIMRRHLIATKQVDHYKAQLFADDKDFRYTMQEYYDGPLIFEINQKKIWAAAPDDSLTMRKLYDGHPARYCRGGRFEGTIYICNTAKDAQKVAKAVAKGVEPDAKLVAFSQTGTFERGTMMDEYIWPLYKSGCVVLKGETTNGESVSFEEAQSLLQSDLIQVKERKYGDMLIAKYKAKY